MFIHETHLPQVLTPKDYTSEEQYRRELEQLFLPGWHCIATFSDFPRDGDYITTELFGYPIILWRSGDEYHAFLNVCPHRFARIKGMPCGHAGERLQCQYHGWEFDCGGNTQKIPDAQSFKPMTKGALGLKKYRSETCGQLIFVTLNDEAPSLEEYLGAGFEIGEKLCGPERRLAATLDYEIDTNWKCKVENSVESYHVDMVHPATFRRAPEPEECEHELAPGWTTYATIQEPPTAWHRLLDRIVNRLAHAERDDEYKHYHFYPHVMFGKMKLFSWMELIIPLSPGRTRVIGKFFCYSGRSGRLISRLLSRGLAKWETGFFETIRDEDCSVLEEVYRGLGAPNQPSEGLVSIREERCFHFQKYIERVTSPEKVTSDSVAMAGRFIKERATEGRPRINQ